MASFFDIMVGLIMVVSVMMALCRGFVKEFFTILSWVLSTVITIYLSPVVQNMFDVSEGKKALYDAVSVLVIFAVSMIVLSFVFGRIIHHLKKNDGLFLDRSLGVLFGLIRGALLICLGYIFIVGFIYDKKPDWIQGKSVGLVEYASKQLTKLNPKDIKIDLDKKSSKKKEDSKATEGQGYSDKIRKEMEELLINDILQ
jgi:membrane protein required for colicin V production